MTCMCRGRPDHRAGGSRRRATTGWRWRSPCSAPSRGPMSGSRNEPPSPSAIRGFSRTCGAFGKRETWSRERIVALAEDLPVRLVLVGDVFRPAVAGVDVEAAIRSPRVTARVSEIAAIPEVRHWVNVQQREAVGTHPQGVVVDGRDIGTVVFPDAPLKVFLTATPDERARRRLAQRGDRIDPAELKRESDALGARDRADSTRRAAPLRSAADAVLLDTTRLSMDEQVARVVALARQRFPH